MSKPLTNFSNGVASFGVPLLGNAKIVASPFGTTYFVNGSNTINANAYTSMAAGSDANDGLSPQTPFLTMGMAFTRIKSGDAINFIGKITEQLVTPANIFDVWINGCGNDPRHADSTPEGGKYATAQWSATGLTAATANLRVIQQGWRFTNFLMTAVDTNAACLELVRNAAAGDLERDASHASVIGVRFSGAGVGIRCGVSGTFTEIPYNVKVINSQFDNMTYAIRGAIEANQWEIRDNFFASNTNQIIIPARNFLIKGNSIGAFTAAASSGGIDLNGGAGSNQVTGNNLSGTYSIAGGYRVANANDNWYGNASSAGFTASDPA